MKIIKSRANFDYKTIPFRRYSLLFAFFPLVEVTKVSLPAFIGFVMALPILPPPNSTVNKSPPPVVSKLESSLFSPPPPSYTTNLENLEFINSVFSDNRIPVLRLIWKGNEEKRKADLTVLICGGFNEE